MTALAKHITVCICTYKRPRLLERLLHELVDQETDGRFNYSIVVIDNDASESARTVVAQFPAAGNVPVRYLVEPEQNISRARNRAIQNANGDFVAFIDDDEFPTARWLLTLFDACHQYQADGVLGPVKPHFEQKPPSWLLEGKFHDRQSYPTGFVIDWTKGRTGNVLLKTSLFAAQAQPFNPNFLTGEDQDFFRRMIQQRYVFVWCNEAVAYETVPPARWTRSFLLRRALLRGKIALLQPSFGALGLATSAIAVPIYIAALPFALVLGHGNFMRFAVKLFDHLGRLLAALGINPVKQPYVTE